MTEVFAPGPYPAWPVSVAPRVVASTGPAGVALVNGTPAILQWTAPNDGLLHRFFTIVSAAVTTLEVGGAVGVTFTPPGGQGFTPTTSVLAAGLGVGSAAGTLVSGFVAGGTTVFLNQTSALTSGAAKVWADIWVDI